MPGFLDALYRESIKYWYEKHDIERIAGPFNFHLYQLSFYEGLFLLAFLLHLVHFYCTRGIKIFTAGFVLLITAFALRFY